MITTSLGQRLVQRFPKMAYCFAYGSGVKKQAGYDEKAQKSAMIDLFICVDDAVEWHEENLKRNYKDYSLMRLFGARFIAEIQDNAAGVYCNTLIPIDDKVTIKYGVIRTEDLCDDLHHWNFLYAAGRLHKPVETLVAPTNREIITNLDKNLDYALHYALLQLDKEFTYFDLFKTVAGISYVRDFRMIFGERKNKVDSIVEPQLEAFLKLYAPNLRKLSEYVVVPDLDGISDKTIQQDKSHEAILMHLESLPSTVRDEITIGLQMQLTKMAHERDYASTVTNVVGSITWNSSVLQSYKNIPTAGLWKALRYSFSKGMKTFM